MKTIYFVRATCSHFDRAWQHTTLRGARREARRLRKLEYKTAVIKRTYTDEVISS